MCKQILFSLSLLSSRISNPKLWVQTCSSIWRSSHIDWKIGKTGCLHRSGSREVHNIDNRCCWLLEGRYNLSKSKCGKNENLLSLAKNFVKPIYSMHNWFGEAVDFMEFLKKMCEWNSVIFYTVKVTKNVTGFLRSNLVTSS